MAKNHYYIVGRNLDTNKVKRISFSRNDSISELENIDLYTMSFENEDDMIISLYNQKLIDGYNYDIFIVSRCGDNINYLKPIYSSAMYSKRLKNIISVSNGIDKYGEEIIDHVIKKMLYEPNFYRYLRCGCSEIYKKFIDYFKDCDTLKDMFMCKYKDGGWSLHSYALIRNVVDAIYSYQLFTNKHKYDAIDEAYIEKENKIKERGDLLDQISIITDPHYSEFQLSIFDMKEENVDYFSYVFENIDVLDKDSFTLDHDGYHLNLDKLLSSVNPMYKNELIRLLPHNVMDLLYRYVNCKYYMDHNLGYDYIEICDEYKACNIELQQLLKNNSTLLNNTYSFLLLYKKCKSVGDQNGFEKRKDFS